MNTVKLQWATPNIDKEIMYMARVSNPDGQDSDKTRLLYYCMEEGHVSPFDMANVCMEVNTTRDIARQILRHKSFFFQEFSQRYADVNKLGEFTIRECRMQDMKNRQNSIEIDEQDDDDFLIAREWYARQNEIVGLVDEHYQWALKAGIAKEQARAMLPEGLTRSRVYMNGTLRSWIFYLKQRLHVSTQKEHRLVAKDALAKLREVAPITMDAFFPPTK